MDEITLNIVDVLLSKGKVMSKKEEKIIMLITAFSVILSVVYMSVFVRMSLDVQRIMSYFSWVPIVIALVCLLIINVAHKNKQQALQCLKDAVEFFATITVEELGGKKRLAVEFVYEGQAKKLYSKPYKKGIFKNHEQKSESVLYSPKHGQVLLLKNM